MAHWDKGLDKSSPAHQIAACGNNRIRVMAGPGTGKSFAMKRRVARLLEDGVDPEKVLAVTFTRVAADDLHRELVGLGVAGAEKLEGRTLHSLGMKILSQQHVLKAIGRVPRVLNKFEVDAMICDLASSFGGKKAAKALLAAFTAAWAQAQGDPPLFPKDSAEKRFAKSAVDWLVFHQGMLIGEIIPHLLVYLKHNPAAPELDEYSHILVDEYQDLNRAEQDIIALLGKNGHICIVGDDDQSIYSFKFAHPEGINDWHTINPGNDDFALSDCHRCPTSVVEVANALIAHNQGRSGRTLTPVAANGPGRILIRQFDQVETEAEWIADGINRLIELGTPPGDIIVLIQRGVIGKKVLERLRELAIPAKSYYEESQLDSEVAHERFALFRLLLDKEDRVALRYLLGVGGTNLRAPAYAKLRVECEKTGKSPWETLELLENGSAIVSGTKGLVDRFGEIQAFLGAADAVKDDITALVDTLFPDATSELAELRLLAIECLQVDEPPQNAKELFGAMLEMITQPEVPPTVDEVRLMSLNKSKGLSSPVVFIGGCIQGLLPAKPKATLPKAEQVAQTEEQRRLFYVGVTRVKADPKAGKVGRLVLSYASKMGIGLAKRAGVEPAFQKGSAAHFHASSFLAELGPTAPAPKKA